MVLCLSHLSMLMAAPAQEKVSPADAEKLENAIKQLDTFVSKLNAHLIRLQKDSGSKGDVEKLIGVIFLLGNVVNELKDFQRSINSPIPEYKRNQEDSLRKAIGDLIALEQYQKPELQEKREHDIPFP